MKQEVTIADSSGRAVLTLLESDWSISNGYTCILCKEGTVKAAQMQKFSSCEKCNTDQILRNRKQTAKLFLQAGEQMDTIQACDETSFWAQHLFCSA